MRGTQIITLLLTVGWVHKAGARCRVENDFPCPVTCCSNNPSVFDKIEGKCVLAKNTQTLITKMLSSMSGPSENVLISPFSITNILKLLLLASSGETYNLLSAELSAIPVDFHEATRCLINEIENSKPESPELTNNIFMSNEYRSASSKYKQDAKMFYCADSWTHKFRLTPDKARIRINRILANRTNHLITNYFEPGSIDDGTQIIFVNTVSFKSPWNVTFPKEKTKKMLFKSSPTEEAMTSFMTSSYKYRNQWLEDDKFFAADVSFKPVGESGEFLFGLLLVKYGENYKYSPLSEIEEYISHNGILSVRSKLEMRDLELTMPKFKMEFEQELNEVFTADNGLDFILSATANYSNLSPDLAITRILHKAVIEIDEEGARGGAGTSVTWVNRAQESVAFDTPFVFYIYHSCSGVVLFQGRYNSPPI